MSAEFAAPSEQPQRLAIITERFWPVCGPTELSVGRLATALTEAGHAAEIFTVRWEKDWPTDLRFAEVPVHRVPRPNSGPWGAYRSLRNLSRQVFEFEPTGILAYGANDLTSAIARGLNGRIPLVLRVDQRLLKRSGKHRSTVAKKLETYALADAILTDCVATLEAIARLDSDLAKKTRVASDLYDLSPADHRTPAKQNAARNALADAHPVLVTETGHPLVVCAAPIDRDGGILDLVRAWSSVLEQYPKARLWLLGDGPGGQDVWDEITELNLIYSVMMPGFFDEASEVFQAADLYVHPLRQTGHDHGLLQAMLSGLCVLGTSPCETSGLIEPNATGLTVEPENPLAMAEAMTHLLSEGPQRERLSRAARRRHAAGFDRASVVADYLTAFRGQPAAESRVSSVE